jgi:hypothetical protein
VGFPGWVKTWSQSDAERREYCLHRTVNLEGTFAGPTVRSALDGQRAKEIPFDWLGVKLNAVLHQVEHLAAADPGVASQNRSRAQGLSCVINVVGFTLRSFVLRILLDQLQLQLAVNTEVLCMVVLMLGQLSNKLRRAAADAGGLDVSLPINTLAESTSRYPRSP